MLKAPSAQARKKSVAESGSGWYSKMTFHTPTRKVTRAPTSLIKE
jgi:hypothetical protein